jgi:hypothetical protein
MTRTLRLNRPILLCVAASALGSWSPGDLHPTRSSQSNNAVLESRTSSGDVLSTSIDRKHVTGSARPTLALSQHGIWEIA